MVVGSNPVAGYYFSFCLVISLSTVAFSLRYSLLFVTNNYLFPRPFYLFIYLFIFRSLHLFCHFMTQGITNLNEAAKLLSSCF